MADFKCDFCDYTTEKENGIYIHKGMQHPGKLPWNNPRTIKRLYWDEGLDSSEIGEKLGCTKKTICQNMRRFKIERRSNQEAQLNYREKKSGTD